MKKRIITIFIVVLMSISFISCTENPKSEAEIIHIPEHTIEMEMIDRRDYWKEHPEENPLIEISKANALARVADAVCPDGASKECLSAVMCVVWNRTKINGFPNTIEEVANQPYQWQGLTASFQADNSITKLAREKLDEWQSESICYLPIPRNCVYMTLDDNGIWFRSTWNGENEVFVPYF